VIDKSRIQKTFLKTLLIHQDLKGFFSYNLLQLGVSMKHSTYKVDS